MINISSLDYMLGISVTKNTKHKKLPVNSCVFKFLRGERLCKPYRIEKGVSYDKYDNIIKVKK
jgi:hypothetical protein